eukprot:11163078-Lingulodinium_polyedra.AAC.1
MSPTRTNAISSSLIMSHELTTIAHNRVPGSDRPRCWQLARLLGQLAHTVHREGVSLLCLPGAPQARSGRPDRLVRHQG